MTSRPLPGLGLAILLLIAACGDQTGPGGLCFSSEECAGSICVTTQRFNRLVIPPEVIDSKVCMATCAPEVVICPARDEACVQTQEDPELWVCLPDGPNKQSIDAACVNSFECTVGLICVCLTGDDCSLENQGVCRPICDPLGGTTCPLTSADVECIDLGNGRGYCGVPEST